MVKASMFLILWCCATVAHAQVFSEPLLVEICANKTVSLVFPSAIVTTDRGSDQVLVQKASENILKVKAAGDSCRETNLTVVTADNKLYSFIVRYNDRPMHLTIQLGNNPSVRADSKWEPICVKVLGLRNNIMGLKHSYGKVSLQLLGWYVQGPVMFCKLKIENRSQIGYDIERLSFYLRDNNTLRRTAAQEILETPLLIHGDTTTLGGKSAREWIVAINKFTIPDQKHFAVEILEKNGGRHLTINVNNRQLMRSKAF